LCADAREISDGGGGGGGGGGGWRNEHNIAREATRMIVTEYCTVRTPTVQYCTPSTTWCHLEVRFQ